MRRWRGRLTRIVSAVDTARLSPLESLAKAYQRAVPEHPADDGLFGPRSMVWRVTRGRRVPSAGLRFPRLHAVPPLVTAARRPDRPLAADALPGRRPTGH